MKLLFIRHGEAEHNIGGYINETNDVASNLTPDGRKEIKKLAYKIRDLEPELKFVYTSPLIRCRQTVRIIQKIYLPHRLKVKVDFRLAEFKSGFNNQMSLWALLRLIIPKPNFLHKKFNQGISLSESYELIKISYSEIKQKHPGDTVLIVAHLHTFKMLNAVLRDEDIRLALRRSLPTGSLYQF